MAEEPSEMVGKVAGKAKSMAAGLMGEHGIFRRLKEEHTEVNMLIKRVLASNDIDVRRELFPKIRRELLGHAKAEEEQLYTLLRQHPSTASRMDDAYREHSEMEELLDRMSTIDYASAEWDEVCRALQQTVKHHVDEEENEIFKLAEEFIDKDVARDLEDRYLPAKERVMAGL